MKDQREMDAEAKVAAALAEADEPAEGVRIEPVPPAEVPGEILALIAKARKDRADVFEGLCRAEQVREAYIPKAIRAPRYVQHCPECGAGEGELHTPLFGRNGPTPEYTGRLRRCGELQKRAVAMVLELHKTGLRYVNGIDVAGLADELVKEWPPLDEVMARWGKEGTTDAYARDLMQRMRRRLGQ